MNAVPVGLPVSAARALPARPSLGQCLTLALLIHVLVVLVFGNTPGGSARRGEGVWGAFDVRLVGGDPGGQRDGTVASDSYTGPEGTAQQRRHGGAVRTGEEAVLPPSTQVGAARLGAWQPQASDAALASTPAAAPAAAGTATATAATAATAALVPAEIGRAHV